MSVTAVPIMVPVSLFTTFLLLRQNTMTNKAFNLRYNSRGLESMMAKDLVSGTLRAHIWIHKPSRRQ